MDDLDKELEALEERTKEQLERRQRLDDYLTYVGEDRVVPIE